ncbi:MAG TPA: hypothetical protein PK509_10210 [Catalimonadaceae bacterium]|nr:hypothetical protein [Catalimonadaceae bacterium]
MKTNKGFAETTQYLGITLTDLGSYLGVSAQFLSQIGGLKRTIPTPVSNKHRELHSVILRIQAENPVAPTDGTAPFSADFLQNRLLDIDKELRSLDKKIKAEEEKARQKEQALITYGRMKTEIPDLTESDLSWIRMQTDKIRFFEPSPQLEQWKWRQKMLKLEREEALRG